jgi:hypothetical protein
MSSWPVLILILLLLLLAAALYQMGLQKSTELSDEDELRNRVGAYPNRYAWWD